MWLSEETLQIDAKGKGEKERYTQLNEVSQRIARRDKKNILNEHCKETEEDKRMGKTKELLKKIVDIKGTFHEWMGMIKDRNCKNLTEAEKVKKSWQK